MPSRPGKEPERVSPADVVGFVAAQRAPRAGRVVRLSDAGPGLSTRTVARRLSSLSGLYAYLSVQGGTGLVGNPGHGQGLLAGRPDRAGSLRAR